MRRAGILGIAALLLAGCKVDARVEIDVHHDGSGTVTATVTLDADAVRRLGGVDRVAATVRLDDLRAADWEISPVEKAKGGITLELTHPFADTADLATRLEDLAGPDGVLREPRATRERGLLERSDSLTLEVDLRNPTVPVASDSELATRLQAAGLDPAALQAELSRRLRDALSLSVVVRLPNGKTETLVAQKGETTAFQVTESGTEWDRVVRIGIALSLTLIAGSFLLAAGVSARRNRRRRRQRRPHADFDRAPLM